MADLNRFLKGLPMSENVDTNLKSTWNLSLLEWNLTCLGFLAIAAFFLIPAIEQARQAAQHSQSKNNLKQIALALVNYHDSFRTLPPGGIFNDQGIPFHSWTTAIDAYTWSSPWFGQVDFNVPWDDPTQIDHFMRRRFILWENPRVTGFPREDGLPVVHYAANSWLLYRNSSVTLDEIGDTSNTLLAAEARGHYLPLGCPGDWRDVDAGYDNSPDSFGCLGRPDTLVVHADGSVRTIRDDIDPAVWNASAGRPGLRPATDRLQGLPWPYVLKDKGIWRKR
jgi:hypothetical protein